MQLNNVVLPAPFGPINPTISHSSTLRETLSRASRPPKRMEMLSSSSTDMGTARIRGVLLVMEAERTSSQPAADRSDDLAEPTRIHDECLQQQYRPDEAGDVVLVVDVPAAAMDGAEEPVEEWVQEAEERRRDDGARAGAESADDNHHEEDQRQPEPVGVDVGLVRERLGEEREDAPGQACDRTGQRKREQLVAHDVDSKSLRYQLVLPQRVDGT